MNGLYTSPPDTAVVSRRTLVRTGLYGAAVGAGLTGVAGCGGSRPADARTGSRRLEEVEYVTGIGVVGREGYAWVADAKGYFAEAGLRVKIVPGQAGGFNHNLVVAGQSQFAAVDISGALIRYGKGTQPTDRGARIVAAIQQQTLIALMALRRSGIAGASDLPGRKVAVAPQSVPETLFPAYARLAGIDASRVQIKPVIASSLPILLAVGQFDAIGQFVVARPGVAAACKVPLEDVIVLPYSQYLTDLYGTVLITSADLAANNPDLVRRFTRALLRGLEYAIENPEEAGRILTKAQPKVDATVAAAELALMRPYVITPPGKPIGTIDPARAARNVATLQGQNLMPNIRPEDAIDFSLVPDNRHRPGSD